MRLELELLVAEEMKMLVEVELEILVEVELEEPLQMRMCVMYLRRIEQRLEET
jgi:hypothetical protein